MAIQPSGLTALVAEHSIPRLKLSVLLVTVFQDEETALHCAAARGHLECVQALLDSGSPVNELDNVSSKKRRRD